MKMALAKVSVGPAVPVLVMALLACAAARIGVVVGGTACDGVSCGMGTCKEIPLPLLNSSYECDCYAGWVRIVPILPSSPCFMPDCPSDRSCYNPTVKMPPVGSNVTQHPCLVMDCGPEGTCVEDQAKPFRCLCSSGATNMLKNPSLPCTKCVIGEDGCPIKNPPPLPSPLPQPTPTTS